jgi:hypothetical protein
MAVRTLRGFIGIRLRLKRATALRALVKPTRLYPGDREIG